MLPGDESARLRHDGCMGTDAREDDGRRKWQGNGLWRWPRSTLLGSLAAASRDRLLQAGTFRQYQAGRQLMHEGDPSAFVIVLLQGIIKATRQTSDGKEVLLAVRVGGDVVGEIAALDNRPR